MACVEAEEIARLAVDLELAVQAAQGEADARRQAEKRLAAAETCLLQRKTGGPAQRSMSPTRTLRGGEGTGHLGHSSGVKGEGEREGGDGWTAVDLSAQDVFQAPSERNSERETSSLPPPPSRGALGSTIASRGRAVHGGGPSNIRRKEFSAVLKGKGRSPSPPRKGRNAAGAMEQQQRRRRPWGSSPPPSPRRGRGAGSSSVSSVTADCRRPLAGAGAGAAASAEHKLRSPRRRRSNERVPGEGVNESSASLGRDPGWSRGGITDKTRVRETAAHDASRHSYVGERGTDTAGERRTRSSATERRGGENDTIATTATTTTPAGADVAAEIRREWEQPTPTSGGGQETSSSVAEAVAAAIRGVDLTETIARELRAAVATVPASSLSSSNDRGGKSSAGGMISGSSRSDLRAYEQRAGTGLGRFEGGDLLSFIRQGGGGGSNAAAGGSSDKSASAAVGTPPSGDGGRRLKSREVAELESDVQHIFQFFAAKDGRKVSGLSGGAR